MIEVIFLAFALAMDAFAVSIGLGVKSTKFDKSIALKAAIYFSVFQALMPLIGFLASVGLSEYINTIDHWIAFIFLSLIGFKMIYESFQENLEDDIEKVSNKVFLFLAIATSIDAMAAGFTLNLLELTPIFSIIIIGIITFLFSYIGVFVGSKSGAFLEDKAELLGGVILIVIAVKILIENLVV
ncbi:manganese efflux pump MntP family protein [Campylobacterota bacterium DY0563]